MILWFCNSMVHSQLQACFSELSVKKSLLLLMPHLPILTWVMSIFSVVSCFSPAFLTHALHWKIPGDNPSLPNSRAAASICLCAVRLSLKDEIDHVPRGAPHSRGSITASFWSMKWRHKTAVHPASIMEPRAQTKCLVSLSPGPLCLIWVGCLGSEGAAGQRGKLCRRMESVSELFLGTIYISLKLLCHLNA